MISLSSDWQGLPHGQVRARKQHRVAWLMMSNPPANNYSYEMMRDLDEGILAARFDDEVDVLVLAGAGDKFYCSGADIGMLNRVSPRYKYYFCLHANETLLRLENTAKLSIAAINGHCVGGGLEVALGCDLRVGRLSSNEQKPYRYGAPEVNLGVLPGTGGTQRLARLLGPAAALELMVEGNLLNPEDALAAGLVHRLESYDGFLDTVQAYAERFTLPNKAALAVGNIKRAVTGGANLSLEAGLSLERELQQRLFTSEDAREGLAAFQEKRTAQFKGT